MAVHVSFLGAGCTVTIEAFALVGLRVQELIDPHDALSRNVQAGGIGALERHGLPAGDR